MEKMTLKIEGMSCGHCVKAVTDAIKGIAGVSEVTVSLEEGTAKFSFDPAKAILDTIKAAIIEEGFSVTG
jgi:copper chaperone